jgi:hypothetical protein
LPENEIQRAAGPQIREAHTAAREILDPSDVSLDPIEVIAASKPRRTTATRIPATRTKEVHVWPMLAAALVAMGVSMLALAAFAMIGHF